MYGKGYHIMYLPVITNICNLGMKNATTKLVDSERNQVTHRRLPDWRVLQRPSRRWRSIFAGTTIMSANIAVCENHNR